LKKGEAEDAPPDPEGRGGVFTLCGHRLSSLYRGVIMGQNT
jgi:hypothetical protein